MLAPASATAMALFVEESRWEPLWTLTVATTAALARAVPAIIAKRATGSAMPCSPWPRRAERRRRAWIKAIGCLIGGGERLLEPQQTAPLAHRTLVLIASRAGQLLDAAGALAAGR